jgi:hypothetical protein
MKFLKSFARQMNCSLVAAHRIVESILRFGQAVADAVGVKTGLCASKCTHRSGFSHRILPWLRHGFRLALITVTR